MADFVSKTANTVRSVVRVILRSKSEQLLKRRKDSNDDVYVVANGPSVANQISERPNLLEGKAVFCMNYAANTDFYEQLKPKYYVICDPNDYQSYSRQSPELQKLCREGIENIVKKTQWPMTFFVPSWVQDNCDAIKLLRLNNNITISYYNSTLVEGFDWFKFYCWEKGFGMPNCQTVLIAAITLAIQLGGKNIFLLGAEHSWLKDLFVGDDNLVYTWDTHSYGIQKRVCYKDVLGFEPISLAEELFSVAKAFEVHNVMREFSNYCCVNIYNATPGSYIDAYERKYL